MYIGTNIALRALQEYYNRIRIGGGTTPTDGANLLDFVEGINDLGLWANMVCWPMRNYQNASTGSKLYSLGGWPLFTPGIAADMDLISSPTWGANGIQTNGTSSYAQTAQGASGPLTGSTNISQFLCMADLAGSKSSKEFNFVSGVGYGNGASYSQRNTGSVLGMVTDPLGANQTLYISGTSTPTLATLSFIGTSFAQGSQVYSLNGGSFSATSISAGGTANTNSNRCAVRIGATFNGTLFPMSASIYLMLNTATTTSQMTAIYNLYKSTLGQGLGLP